MADFAVCGLQTNMLSDHDFYFSGMTISNLVALPLIKLLLLESWKYLCTFHNSHDGTEQQSILLSLCICSLFGGS